MTTSLAAPELRVLVADPCPDTSASLAILLELWGYRVETAQDAEGALSKAAAFRPDVLLVDPGLPSSAAWALAARLRAELPGKRLLFIAMSGFSGEGYQVQVELAGFQHFLLKPFEPVNLARLLEEWKDRGARPAEELVRLLTSLGAAAEVVEAIDNPALQKQRGWDLVRWRYDLVPFGVRFKHYREAEEVDAEVVAVDRAGLPGPLRETLPPSRSWLTLIVLQ